MSGCWIAVASTEHVRRGREGGFMQVCHGKAAPLRRIRRGDRVIYYSPTGTFGGKDRLQAFTAIGSVIDDGPYDVDLGNGFQPYRRAVAWEDVGETPVHPLLDTLAFTAGRPNWGYQLRFGLFAICDGDAEVIEAAMRAAASG
ncbi:EVE domain-containing protein [Inquilinus sp. YAF38]|uniref:EVE domain-containing protein n=1 Tax=Inquilinus sp. YAF38 TaxID=3233084 RepID=UPI003F937ADE